MDFGVLEGLLVTKDSMGRVEPVSCQAVLRNRRYIGLYFSGQWCPPCKLFTPKLVDFYRNVRDKEKGLEIIFVSADVDQDSFLEYYNTMPWMAIEFDATDVASDLRARFDVFGFPRFVLLENTGKVLLQNARADVLEDPHGNNFPWL